MVNQPIEFVFNETELSEVFNVIKANAEAELKNIGTIKTENYNGPVVLNAYSAAVSDSGKIPYTDSAAIWKAEKDYNLVIKFGPVDQSNSDYSTANHIDKFKLVRLPISGSSTFTTADLAVAAVNKKIVSSGLSDTLQAVKVTESSKDFVAINLIAKECGEHASMVMFDLCLEDAGSDLADYVMIPTKTIAIAGVVDHAAKPAFGSYLSLLRTIKFPTEAATSFSADWSDGMPVRGSKYSQLIIPFKVDRGPIGDSKFGENVTTSRCFTIWAPVTLAASLKTELDKILKAAA